MKLKGTLIRKTAYALLMPCVLAWCLSSCTQMYLIHRAGDQPDAEPVRAIKARTSKETYVVRGMHIHRKHVLMSNVWGYRLADGSTYRFYNGMAYQVVQTKPLLIYELEEWVGDTRWLTYRFSFTPKGDMYELDKKTCLAVFRLDECVVGYLNQMPNRLIAEPDRHGVYGLANVYRLCHSNQ